MHDYIQKIILNIWSPNSKENVAKCDSDGVLAENYALYTHCTTCIKHYAAHISWILLKIEYLYVMYYALLLYLK